MCLPVAFSVVVGVGLIMSFEVEYCLTANSVICRIYECFVEFCFVNWTEFAFYSVGTRLVVAWSTRVFADVIQCARRSRCFNE